jgi:hypothetical protein
MKKEIYNPGRRDFLKGVVIGAGGLAFGSMLIHPKGAMAQSIEGYLEKVPMEVRWSNAAGGQVRWMVISLKTLLDKQGREKYVEYIKNFALGSVPRAKAQADGFGFTGNDAKSAAAIRSALQIIWYGPQTKFEFEEATAEKAKLKCTNCAIWNAVQADKITDDLCSVLSQYAWDGFVKAVNPKLTSTLVKARPLGDSVCEWVFELKA